MSRAYEGKPRNFFTADGPQKRSSFYLGGIPKIVPIPLIEFFDGNPDKGDLIDILGGFRESRTSIVD